MAKAGCWRIGILSLHYCHGEITGDRRVAGQGKDHQQVPRPELRGPCLHGTCTRPPQEQVGRGRGARLRAGLCRDPEEEEGPHGPYQRSEEGRRDLSGAGPRSRRRGHQLSPGGGVGAKKREDSARPLQRDHQTCRGRSDQTSARDRPGQGRCAAGASRARSSRGLSDLTPFMGEGPPWTLRGPRPIGRASYRVREGTGNPGVPGGGVLVGPCRPFGQRAPVVRRQAHQDRWGDRRAQGRGVREVRGRGVSRSSPSPSRRSRPRSGVADPCHPSSPASSSRKELASSASPPSAR